MLELFQVVLFASLVWILITFKKIIVPQVVDVRKYGDDCRDTFVYVADVSGFSFLVVDVVNDRSWRITHRNLYPFPNWGTFNIAGTY